MIVVIELSAMKMHVFQRELDKALSTPILPVSWAAHTRARASALERELRDCDCISVFRVACSARKGLEADHAITLRLSQTRGLTLLASMNYPTNIP